MIGWSRSRSPFSRALPLRRVTQIERSPSPRRDSRRPAVGRSFDRGDAPLQRRHGACVERDLDEAEHTIEESVRGARRAGNVTSVGNWLRALGSVALARHHDEGAGPRFAESLALGREFGQPWCISHSLSNLALVAQEAHDHATARRLLEESIAMQRERRERLGLAANLEVFGRLAAAQGHSVRAARLYACTSVLREDVGGVDPCEPGWPDPEPQVAELRAALAADVFADAWEAGRALTLDESLDYSTPGGARGRAGDEPPSARSTRLISGPDGLAPAAARARRG